MISGRKNVIGFRVVSIVIVCLLLATSFGPVGARPATNGPEAGGPIPQTAIFSDVLGEVNNDVPGFPGVHFESFDRPFGSPNGNWILSADTDLATTNDEVILVNGVVKFFEGDPAGWTGGTENIGLTDTKLGINDAAEWVFANNTNAATNDDYIVMVSAGDVYTTVAKEGDPVPQLPPATWDDTLDSSVISADGTVGHAGDGIDGGPPTTQDEIVVFGSSVVAQQGVTVPGGQVGAETWEFFDVDDFFVSADGMHWMLQGDLTGDTNFDDVADVDGNVVVQEGVVLPGSGFAEPVDLSGIVGIWMGPGGDWFVRGNNDVTEHDWVYSNGTVIAQRGAPIYAGATEVYSDTLFADLFFLHVSDSFGNYVIGGVTDNPDPLADGVLVVNNQEVVARQGDPIDLDNNGTFDDGVFINTFGNDDGFLDDAGNFYTVVTMMDAAGAAAGDAFLLYDLSSILNPQLPPTLSNVTATSPINENDSTTLTGDVSDPNDDPLTLVVDWADGTVMTYTYPSGTTSFTETHQYLDDDPTATPSDSYGVTLILDDGNGGTATGAVEVTVNNVAPAVTAMADNTIVTLGAPVNFTGAFTDVGTLDTHTIEWDFGDGNSASGTLMPTHTYTATGVYVVNLTVTDDDTGVGAAAITISVNEPTDVSLSSFGKDSATPGFILWLLPLLALLAFIPVLVARRKSEG
jgi:PKD repeat protein